MELWGLSSHGEPEGPSLLDRLPVWAAVYSAWVCPGTSQEASTSWRDPSESMVPDHLLPVTGSHMSPIASACPQLDTVLSPLRSGCSTWVPQHSVVSAPSLWGTPKCSKGLDLYREKVRSVLLMPRSKRDNISSIV